MQDFRPLSGESKVIILLLVIFLFGVLILNLNKNKSCGCRRKSVCRERKQKPYVITGYHEIPEWVVNLKRRNREMFGNI